MTPIISTKRRGNFVSFTGTDGAGKSTQAALLAKRLNASGEQTYVTEAKDDFTPQLLKRWGRIDLNLGDPTYSLVVAVERLKHEVRTVQPMLAAGINVVDPRSVYCFAAFAKAVGHPAPESLEDLLTFCGEPDLTVMLDVPINTTIERVRQRGIDDEDPAVMHLLRENLFSIAVRKNIIVIDGNRPKDEIASEIWKAYTKRFGDT